MNKIDIGIFDSGIGGLAIARAIYPSLRHMNALYVADNLHFPYGNKPISEVRNYCEEITEKFINLGATHVVIACNTATTVAKEYLETKYPHLKITDVINPVVNSIATLPFNSSIGIIATKNTVKSEFIKNKIAQLAPHLETHSYDAGELAQIIEEHYNDQAYIQKKLPQTLSSINFSKHNYIGLFCTHYLFIQKEISQLLEGNTSIIDTPLIMQSYISNQMNAVDAAHAEGNWYFTQTGNDPFFSRKVDHLIHFPHKIINVFEKKY